MGEKNNRLVYLFILRFISWNTVSVIAWVAGDSLFQNGGVFFLNERPLGRVAKVSCDFSRLFFPPFSACFTVCHSGLRVSSVGRFNLTQEGCLLKIMFSRS